MGKCGKVCEFCGKKSDVTANFSGSLGSFSTTLRLRLIKDMFVNFYLDLPAAITITAGSTSTTFTITTSLACKFKVLHSYGYPFLYNANGTSPANPYHGYVSFSGQNIVFNFPTFPADATQLTLLAGVFGSYISC